MGNSQKSHRFGIFVKKPFHFLLIFTENFCNMAETKQKKIEKKAYAIMQEALFEKQADGSYSVRDMAKEGMTTLKKHSTNLVVVCTDSSIEDVTELLKKNEIPHDKVIKMEEKFDYLVTGKEQSVSVWSWESALDDLGWKVSHKEEPEDKQKKADKSFGRWFDEQVKNIGCICCD